MTTVFITGSTDVALADGDELHEFLMDLNIQHSRTK